MRPFVLSHAAAADLDDIYEYIAKDNPSAAARLVDAIYDQIVALTQMPGMGHRRPDLADDPRILIWPVGSYLILYTVQDSPPNAIQVWAIAHGKRDIAALIRRRGL